MTLGATQCPPTSDGQLTQAQGAGIGAAGGASRLIFAMFLSVFAIGSCYRGSDFTFEWQDLKLYWPKVD